MSGGRVNFDFSGRCVALTGGGGRIALECARLVAGGGGHVHLVDSREQALAHACQALAASGARITAAASDLSSPGACRAALLAAGAPLDGLAHLAGVFEDDPFDCRDGAADSPVFERALEANLASAYRVGAVFPDLLATQAPAHLVFVSSLAAERGAPLHVAYATAKAGLHGLVRSLARRLGPKVLVNGVSPGIVDSPMAASLIERIGERGYREGCLRRYGSADEIAKVIVFLLSDGAGYLTGEMIRCDGGASTK